VWRAGLLAALAATELTSLSLAPVVIVTLLSGLLGAVALWLLTRRGPSGVRLWTLLAVAYAVLSGLAAFGLDVGLGRQLGLFLFHLLAAAGTMN
jgi:uncharacterized protein DUF6069